MNSFLDDVKTKAMGGLVQIGVYVGLGMVVVVGIIIYNMVKGEYTVVDNPTQSTITFQVDGKEYTLEPKSSQSIKLGKGEHTLVYSGETSSFKKEKKVALATTYSVLNPTRSPYVLTNEIYVAGYMSDEEAESKLPKYDCEDEEGNADCLEKVINDVFIQGDIDYGIDENFPDDLSLSKGNRYVVKSKLFREEDYIAYLEE